MPPIRCRPSGRSAPLRRQSGPRRPGTRWRQPSKPAGRDSLSADERRGSGAKLPFSRATPDSARWENSIQVAIPWSSGRNSPWQRGQSRPHPAPEPVALTTAPCRMTMPLTAKVVQARAAVVMPRGWPSLAGTDGLDMETNWQGFDTGDSTDPTLCPQSRAGPPFPYRPHPAAWWNPVSKGTGFGDAVRTRVLKSGVGVKPKPEFASCSFSQPP